jgi:hypothetical protein
MASVLQIAPPDAIPRIQRVQTVTIVWMSVEALVSLFAAWRARSPALLAFGGDSAIELFSAVIVLWRFRASDAHEDVEKRGCPYRGSLVVRAGCICRDHFGRESAGLERTQAHTSRDSHFGCSRRRHAVACERKAATVRNDGQCCVAQMLARALRKLGYEVAIKPINIDVWIPTVD